MHAHLNDAAVIEERYRHHAGSQGLIDVDAI